MCLCDVSHDRETEAGPHLAGRDAMLEHLVLVLLGNPTAGILDIKPIVLVESTHSNRDIGSTVLNCVPEIFSNS
ncbi:MAG: hypothetical protein J07HQX50_00250 [Haloquadratum sp. J07HQX50]|nr:MAG: hypothetical protein J07HQX50_00250 [Haloquadratum sp. J07HQX50]